MWLKVYNGFPMVVIWSSIVEFGYKISTFLHWFLNFKLQTSQLGLFWDTFFLFIDYLYDGRGVYKFLHMFFTNSFLVGDCKAAGSNENLTNMESDTLWINPKVSKTNRLWSTLHFKKQKRGKVWTGMLYSGVRELVYIVSFSGSIREAAEKKFLH